MVWNSANVYGQTSSLPTSSTYDRQRGQREEQQNFSRYLAAKPEAQANPYTQQLFAAAGQNSGAGSASELQSTSNQLLSQMLRDPTKLQAMPGYQFQMDQGLQALNRGLAGRGHLNSGNRDIELTKYGQGLAAQQYMSMADMLTRAGSGAAQQAGQTFGNLLDASKFGYSTQASEQDRLTKQFNDEMVRAQTADPLGDIGMVDSVYRKYRGGSEGYDGYGWGY
jgi:hypothetical protein